MPKVSTQIKIPTAVHSELKAFIKKNVEDTIRDFAGLAIMKELKERDHKFKSPKK